MVCPICNTQLTSRQKDLFMCANGHGTLVTGKYLSDIEEAPAIAEPASKSSSDTKHEIACPHCSKTMHKVSHNGTSIIIDSCTNCQYRWLDSGEISKIKHFKPNIRTKDLLFITEVDEQIRLVNKREIKEANPRLPLQGSYRAGSEVVAAIGGGSQARLGAIVGQGLYAIIKGLVHSKTSRILTLMTLLIFGLLLLLLFWDYRDILRGLY
jgi:Zn-finger nucleic acid-binding protein